MLIAPVLHPTSGAHLPGLLRKFAPTQVYVPRVVAWSPDPIDYGIGREVIGLREDLRRAGVRRANLVATGWSTGIALAFAMSDPDRVESLCLVDPGPLGREPHPEGSREHTYEFDLALELSGPEMFERFGMLLMSEEERPTWTRYRSGRLSEEVYSRIRIFARALLAYRAEYDKLREVRGPVLIIVGGRGHSGVLRRAAWLAEWFQNVRLEHFADGDRFQALQDSAPRRFLDQVRGLWEEGRARRPPAGM